ncbi:DUF5753 domain-containing protein [Streptomyces iconiensis]
MRNAANMSADAAARQLGVPRTNIPNMESGRSGISRERVHALADIYGCTEKPLVNALAEMTGTQPKGWWERYRGELPDAFADIAEMEWHARRLHIAVTVHLPGLVQTREHARAVFQHVIPDPAEADVAQRVAHRMDRQRALDRPDPPEVELILHEAALRMRFGGREAARQQLLRLLDIARRGTVELRVIPFSAGGFPGAGQSVTYAAAAVPALDTVELDSTHGPEFLDSEQQLRKYRAQLGAMRSVALSRQRSQTLVLDIINELLEERHVS